MNRHCFQAVRLMLPLLAAGALAMAGCRRGGTVATDTRPRVEPYPSFFQAQVEDDIFLFADLREKQRFDISPAALEYEQFVSRTGQRVFITNQQPELVPRIEVAYERAVDTELMPVDALRAPLPSTPPQLATRPSGQETDAGSAVTSRPATAPAAVPATRPATVPVDRLGPTGDPQPRAD